MNSQKPLVSVFIPYYNDRSFLKDSIESVLHQTYQNFELILLNHASTDGSKEFVHSYKDERIKHIDIDKNLGAGSGILMLEFLKLAKGKYTKLFCADDIMNANCIEILVNYLEDNPNKDIVWADMDYINQYKKPLNTKWSLERPNFNFEHNEIDTLKYLFKGIGFIPYPSVLVKTDVLKHADIDKSFIMLIDMGIWTDLLIKDKKAIFIKDTLVKYRIHGGQTASCQQADLVRYRSFYESIKFIEIFNKITDINLIKDLCDDVPFAKDLTEQDKKFIPFIIAYHNLASYNTPYRFAGYQKLHDLMQDDNTRKEIEKRFNFGIKEFRDLYSRIDTPIKTEPPIKELGMRKLSFLLVRRIWKRITFQDLKNFIKKKGGNYTM